MPSHIHNDGTFDRLVTSNCVGTATKGDDKCGLPNVLTSAPMQARGGNQPHNNMPPYVVLRMCKKTKENELIDYI